jgi:alpha/beta superfamily hydrolase
METILVDDRHFHSVSNLIQTIPAVNFSRGHFVQMKIYIYNLAMAIIRKNLSFTKLRNGHKEKLNLELAIHPFGNGRVIVNYPGAEGSIDGYSNKYVTLAEYIVAKNLAAVVRLGNPYISGLGWDVNLREALAYVLKNSESICQFKTPEIYLMGFSAGARAIASLAWEYPEVKRILLMEPATLVQDSLEQASLVKFKGEVCIVVGTGSEALGEDVGKKFYDNAKSASKREIFVIADCDHQFRGEKNGRIISQAPFYAFCDDSKPAFPDNNGGIKLYD